MAEAQPIAAESVASEQQPGTGLNLTPAQLDQLSERVYKLLKQGIIQGRERRGTHSDRGWR